MTAFSIVIKIKVYQLKNDSRLTEQQKQQITFSATPNYLRLNQFSPPGNCIKTSAIAFGKVFAECS